MSQYGCVNTNNGIYRQSQPNQHHQMPSSNAGPSSYGVGPTRTTPTINTHAPPLRSTSTRRYSPDALLGPEAPTQPRNYTHPSVTSRKEIPSYYLKQQRRASPSQTQSSRYLSEDEDDELTEEPLAENATDQEKIEYKRRQNTLAARRSRARKLVYTQQLEATVEHLTQQKEMWRTRALTLRQLLKSHNIPCPDFKD